MLLLFSRFFLPWQETHTPICPCGNLNPHLPFHEMADQSLVYTLDEALCTIGFGKFQGLVFAYAGLGWIAEALEIMLLSFIGPAVQSEWGLSPTEESMISTVVFAGMLVGAYTCGLISDTYGRKKGFLGVAVVNTVAGFLSAFSPSYIWLVILRCLVGTGLGGGHVFLSWFLEFVPTPNRGTWMVIFSTFWVLGTIFEASLAWIVMPRLGWRWLLALSSAPSFALLILYGLTPESPRYLYMKGRTAEAQDLLKKVALLNQTNIPPGELVSDQITKLEEESGLLEDTLLLSSTRKNIKDSKTSPSSLFPLFSTKLIRTTLLLWLIYFGNTFSYYGIILLTSKLSSGKSKCSSLTLLSENIQDADSLYIDVFVTTFAELPGLVLSAILVDRVGRKISMEIMLVLGFILLLPLVSHQHETLTTTLLFGARMFISTAFKVVSIYSAEAYPTSVRATGVGSATAIGRIGGMICPLVAVGLVSGCHQTAAVTLFEVAIVISGLCVLFFPLETKGRELIDTI